MEQFQSTWAPLLYLAAGILFILALRGLSSPATSRAGNRNGMIGMMIAVGTTIALFWTALDAMTWGILAAGALVGGGIGAYIARKIPMTDMPQLVAAFHSLVGLAAVLVAAAALYAPVSFGIGTVGSLATASLIELALGSAIGALTFTGSVIAFAKLNGNMSGAPILLPARHVLNILIGAGIIGLIVVLVMSGGSATWGVLGPDGSCPHPRDHADHSDRGCGHAGRRVDAQLLLWLGGRRAWLHARQFRADYYRRSGGVVRCDPLLHYV